MRSKMIVSWFFYTKYFDLHHITIYEIYRLKLQKWILIYFTVLWLSYVMFNLTIRKFLFSSIKLNKFLKL